MSLCSYRTTMVAILALLFAGASGTVLAQQPDANQAHEPEVAQEEPAGPEQAGGDEDAAAEQEEAESTWIDAINRALEGVDDAAGEVVAVLAAVFFYDFGTSEWLGASVPFVVLWLFAGAVFFTLWMGFVNLRGFRHAVNVTLGKYDNPKDKGEVTHFQALSSALSATIGLGNIAGVAIAVGVGGPGAVLWMIVAGFLGMSSKFTECTLGQKYRKVAPDGSVSGGPMRYLEDGLRTLRLGPLGKGLAVFFAVMCIGASLGGGNAFQVSQSLGVVREQAIFLDDVPWVYGLVMALLVGIVIIGGIRRIAATAERIVPAMCVLYVIVSITILVVHYDHVLPAFGRIVQEAFSPGAIQGGIIGVLVVGIQRAAFSNEAGIGSAAIAHSAARTEEPIREGMVALLGPFIDTIVVCTMTGLVIVITGVADAPENAELVELNRGAALTAAAWRGAVSWFPYLLAAAVLLFAYSTMISWSYYGERCWTYLFGPRSSLVYKILFLVFIFLGSIITATNILDLSDMMILSMAFPNILGVVLLSGQVRRDLRRYWQRYRAGEFPTFK